MSKNKKIGCLSFLLLSPLTMAMQPLDDQSLSTTTGQDGITIGVQIQKIDFDQVALINTNNSTYTDKSALVMAASPSAATPVIGVDFVKTFSSDGSIQNSSTELFKAAIDTDAGTGTNGAFSNIAISLGNEVNGIRIRPFSVYLVPGGVDAISSVSPNYSQKSIFSSGTTLKSTNIKEFLRTSDIDIKFISGNKPSMNLQLGAAPQGHMMMFGGAIDSICGPTTAKPDGCTFKLISGATSAKFDFQLLANDTDTNDHVTGLSLKGFYAGIEGNAGTGPTELGGLVFGNIGTSEKFNLKLNNVQLGNTIPTVDLDSNIFNGLQNGSMGNFGMTGVSVTNLKTIIRGM
ncbi:hypothetical protein F967_02183 [Acinetobacter sp. CIP 102637]|uniref:DUF6160 family protein n=1 Tax=Acinetobacter sp. CIP 102637 TaxID=1144669 RepID=UPI0002CED948|nr:DUF6160 family protein [Acinetobacter sp. CIP 102637]ENV05430.1 hypothetical protein F967_02183 [Acinetobacter sp. CIP 102637]